MPVKGAESPIDARNFYGGAEARTDRGLAKSAGKVGRAHAGGESQPGKGLKFVIQKVSYNAPGAMFGVGKRLIASVVEDRCK